MPAEWSWVRTGIPPKCKLSKWRKEPLKASADEFVKDFYKATFIRPPPKEERFNYIVDFSTKWHGPYLQFIARYACPGPNARSPFFELAFARLAEEYNAVFCYWLHHLEQADERSVAPVNIAYGQGAHISPTLLKCSD